MFSLLHAGLGKINHFTEHTSADPFDFRPSGASRLLAAAGIILALVLVLEVSAEHAGEISDRRPERSLQSRKEKAHEICLPCLR